MVQNPLTGGGRISRMNDGIRERLFPFSRPAHRPGHVGPPDRRDRGRGPEEAQPRAVHAVRR
ncbi:hypothetical protein SCOCK_700016 [Actinacidiphila cocklensis]|uniref:Uncharacterized protein n=1 Tax=Actinacidiphila cocklensis TaxID=887465 RepID=A0A9W4DY33_9ACTN|nr:hypothetical protein SCOCK_700016 [Actinacidiphila cocklensis]